MRKEPVLSLIFPVFNEEKRILNLKEVLAFLRKRKLGAEVIVVDDGSTDKTLTIARELSLGHSEVKLISYPANKGKGYAVKTGVESALGKYICFMDIDLSVSLDQLDKFWQAKGSAPVLIASRRVPGAEVLVHQNPLREALGGGFSALSKLILGLGVRDVTCGMKWFEKNAAAKIFGRLKTDGWAFDAEILYLAKRFGLPVLEIPVAWKNSPRTKVRLVKDVFCSLRDLLRIRTASY